MSHLITMEPIGVVHSEHHDPMQTPIQTVFALGCPGRAEILPSFQAGLEDIAEFSHLILLYHMDGAEPAKMLVKPFLEDRVHGVFATRSPHRPNGIGLSIVRLVRHDHGTLYLEDVDILDGTPLLDIKPYVPRFDARPDASNGWVGRVDPEQAQLRGMRGWQNTR
jgi:tRNA (adenine37-N6)-methyltransferase